MNTPPPSDDLRRPLTAIEWEIVERLNRSESCRHIAEAMGYGSLQSVRWHIRGIHAQLPPDLVEALDPIEAIVVWRRWLAWKGARPPVARQGAA